MTRSSSPSPSSLTRGPARLSRGSRRGRRAEPAPAPRDVPGTVTEGLPFPLGVRPRDGGVNAAFYSETADAIDVCLFDASGTETRVRLPERSGHVFHGFLPGVSAGARYGLRVHGAWDPAAGIRHNAHKLLLDPGPGPSRAR